MTCGTMMSVVEQLCVSRQLVSTLVCYRLRSCAATLGTKLLIVKQLCVRQQLGYLSTLLFVTGCKGVKQHMG